MVSVDFHPCMFLICCLFLEFVSDRSSNSDSLYFSLNIVERMLDHINQPLTEFLSKKTVQMLSPKSISYCSIVISSILHLLVAVLDRFSSMEKVTVVHSGKNESSLHGKVIPLDSNNAKKDVEESKSITNAFAFAFVWAVAGHIHERFVYNRNFISLKKFVTYSCEPPKIIDSLQLTTWLEYNTNDRLIRTEIVIININH